MRTSVFLAAVCAALVAVGAAPAPEPAPAPAPAPQPDPQPDPAAIDDNTPEIIEIIAPAASAQETLSTLNLGAPGSDLSERNKRTIGILRQLFPTLTQIIEQKVQELTSTVLQTFGPIVFRALLGNRSGGGGDSNNGAGGGTIELDDDDDDDDDDNDDVTPSSVTTTTTIASIATTAAITTTASTSSIESITTTESTSILELFKTTESTTTSESSMPTTTISTTTEKEDEDDDDDDDDDERRRRKRALYFLPNAIAEDNQLLSGAESQQAEVRVAFGEGSPAAAGQETLAVAASEDQQTAAQTNSASIDEISLDDADNSEENRNKRFLSFGGTGGASGGGSGNFLFDIVRRPGEAIARAAGGAFRLFAGTDSLNLGLTASHTATRDPNELVAGSSSGSAGDAGAGADGDDAGAAKGDNLTEGVPGPITRLFIIANRGIANLIQDLILRIAQTSERIVNFKARLITSII